MSTISLAKWFGSRGRLAISLPLFWSVAFKKVLGYIPYHRVSRFNLRNVSRISSSERLPAPRTDFHYISITPCIEVEVRRCHTPSIDLGTANRKGAEIQTETLPAFIIRALISIAVGVSRAKRHHQR